MSSSSFKNAVYFSVYFSPILKNARFVSKVLLSFFKILFKKEKALVLVQLKYSQKHLFDKSYLIISYQFENAILYNFKGIKTTANTQPLVLNLANLKKSTITLTVKGFFQKKVYRLEIVPENVLITDSFKTRIEHINTKKKFSNKPVLKAQKVTTTNRAIQLKKENLQFNYSTFNQTDFL